MHKLEKLQIIKNVSSSWFALGTSVVVGFFLWPFILHRLGEDAAGIWVLIFSITGYYGIFDLGIRSSVIRYVAKAKATNDPAQASRLVSTSLFSYSCIGAATLLITLVASFYIVDFHGRSRRKPGASLHAYVEPLRRARQHGPATKDFRSGKQVLRVHNFSYLRDADGIGKIRHSGVGRGKICGQVLPGAAHSVVVNDPDARPSGVSASSFRHE
jgi:hypothetical protein